MGHRLRSAALYLVVTDRHLVDCRIGNQSGANGSVGATGDFRRPDARRRPALVRL